MSKEEIKLEVQYITNVINDSDDIDEICDGLIEIENYKSMLDK